jgi:hypothetical protein
VAPPNRIPRAEVDDKAKSFPFNNLAKLGKTDFRECVAGALAIRCAATPPQSLLDLERHHHTRLEMLGYVAV